MTTNLQDFNFVNLLRDVVAANQFWEVNFVLFFLS